MNALLVIVRQEGGRVVVRVLQRRVDFVPETCIDRQVRCHLPVILPKERIGVTQAVHRRVGHLRQGSVIRVPKQKRCIGIADRRSHRACSVEHILPRPVIAEYIFVVVRQPANIAAEFEGALTLYPGQIVQQLDDLALLIGGIESTGPLQPGNLHIGNRRHRGDVGDTGNPHLPDERCRVHVGVQRRADGVEAAAKFVDHVGRDGVVVRHRQAAILLRLRSTPPSNGDKLVPQKPTQLTAGAVVTERFLKVYRP